MTKQIEWYDNAKFVWVSSHYDVHIKGLVLHHGILKRFEFNFNREAYMDEDRFIQVRDQIFVYDLKPIEKLKWLFNKFTFELCVGKHWTYKDGKRMEAFKGCNRLLFRLYCSARKILDD